MHRKEDFWNWPSIFQTRPNHELRGWQKLTRRKKDDRNSCKSRLLEWAKNICMCLYICNMSRASYLSHCQNMKTWKQFGSMRKFKASIAAFCELELHSTWIRRVHWRTQILNLLLNPPGRMNFIGSHRLSCHNQTAMSELQKSCETPASLLKNGCYPTQLIYWMLEYGIEYRSLIWLLYNHESKTLVSPMDILHGIRAGCSVYILWKNPTRICCSALG